MTRVRMQASGIGLVVLASCRSPQQTVATSPPTVDVRQTVRQKMPARVLDRGGWADDIATAFARQKLPETLENVCVVLAVAEQESGYQADPVVPGLHRIAWQEIERRAAMLHIPAFVVHAALKIPSSNSKRYSERLDSVTTEKQLSAIFDDVIDRLPMG